LQGFWGWKTGGDGIFCTCPDQSQDPPSLLYTWYWFSFLGQSSQSVALTTNPCLALRYQMAVWAFMASHRENFIVIVFDDVINKLDKYFILFYSLVLFNSDYQFGLIVSDTFYTQEFFKSLSVFYSTFLFIFKFQLYNLSFLVSVMAALVFCVQVNGIKVKLNYMILL